MEIGQTLLPMPSSTALPALMGLERPSIKDPRWGVAGMLALYNAYAFLTPYFDRSAAQWLCAVGSCLAAELLVSLVRRRPMFWLSSLITGLGLFLLCDSPLAWPYAVLGAVSVLSKLLLRDQRGHFFNPNCLGMVVGLLWLPRQVIICPYRWVPSIPGTLVVAAIGLAVAIWANRWKLGLSYQASFFATAIVRSIGTGAKLITMAAPMTGAAFQLFTFYMITDPSTTPKKPLPQIAFGALIGLLDGLLRHFQRVEAPFFALFLLCAIRPLLGEAWQPRPR